MITSLLSYFNPAASLLLKEFKNWLVHQLIFPASLKPLTLFYNGKKWEKVEKSEEVKG